MILAMLVTFFFLMMLPARIRMFPLWIVCFLGMIVIVPIAGVGLSSAKARWLRMERRAILLFFAVCSVGIIANLANLINAMLWRSREITGLQLLASSIAVWITNILMFSLLYWEIDRGGPEPRANKAWKKPDWLFPQEEAQENVPAGWRPTFVDYLFMGFTTATAFSPTEAVPLTPRAKLLMMLESTISLITLVMVGARAINILGT